MMITDAQKISFVLFNAFIYVLLIVNDNSLMAVVQNMSTPFLYSQCLFTV